VAGDGAAVEETRAELTHNGGRSSLGGWRARGVGVGTRGAHQCWGFLWAQDAEQVLYITTNLPINYLKMAYQFPVVLCLLEMH
jgi:hypothetical protein